MRIETFPLIIGVLVAMLGIGIMFDAWTSDPTVAEQERRRRPRIERHRNGEAMIGLGVLALAAALIGRDSWRYSTLVVIIGALFLIVGAGLNAHYIRELFVNRGPLRRREEPDEDVRPARAERDVGLKRPVAPSAAESARTGAEWDGPERRKTPRDGGRKPRRPEAGSDDPMSPSPNP